MVAGLRFHGGDGGLEVVGGERLVAGVGQLPKAKTGVAPRVHAVDVLGALEHVIVRLAGDGDKVGAFAVLEDQRLEGAARL